MNLRVTKPAQSDVVPASAARFTYASGARPLAGYTIKRGIGHGGFGEVYYALSDAGKEVALKLVRRNLDVELRGATQCLNLKHPNLLALYDIRRDDQDDAWVVMEYVCGESLEDVLDRHPQGLPPEEALAWMHGIAAGVAYLHDHGIVHRDLKPGNLFLDQGIVKVGDYGLSKFISCSRRSGQTGSVGTVHYMAPEVANGRYGKEIDIYAMGIVLYEMLTGRVPFEGESVGEILMKHLTADPDLSMLAEPYRTIVARCLAKDPQRRFGLVHELAAMLPPPEKAGGAWAAWPQHAAARSNAAEPPASEPPVEPILLAQPAIGDEEPIWRWLRTTWRDAQAGWERAHLPTWQKNLIVLAVLVVLIYSLPFWFFPTVLALALYGVYRGVRAMVISSPSSSAGATAAARASASAGVQATAAPAAAAAEGSPPPRAAPPSPTRQRWRAGEQPEPALVIGTPRERSTELVGSLLLAALVASVTAVVMMLLRGRPPEPNQFVWLALCGTLGAWAVLLPAKLWEGVRGEATRRRFVMMVIGLAFGLVAYLVQQGLLVNLPYDARMHSGGLRPRDLPAFYAVDGSPLVYAYLAYFGFLFLIPRWWRLAEPLRETRLSLWLVTVIVFWAAVLNVFWAFPQPWGIMLAATIAVAVQLSSPWISRQQRAAYRRPA